MAVPAAGKSRQRLAAVIETRPRARRARKLRRFPSAKPCGPPSHRVRACSVSKAPARYQTDPGPSPAVAGLRDGRAVRYAAGLRHAQLKQAGAAVDRTEGA